MTHNGGEVRAESIPRGAAGLVGKTVLVDVAYTAPADGPTRHRQYHGVVSAVTQRNVELHLSGGNTLDLPPDPSLYRPASPGPHRLPSTGETVAHVDLVIAFTAAGPYGAGAFRAVTEAP